MTIAEEVALLLELAGIGVRGGSADWAIRGDFSDDGPDRQVAVVGEGGASSDLTLDRRTVTNPAFRVTVRGTGKDEAFARAKLIHDYLDGASELLAGGARYVIVRALSPPFPAGSDERGRWLYDTGYQAKRSGP